MINFKEYCHINELAYKGNLGVMELIKFHSTATPEQKKEMKEHLAAQRHEQALALLHRVTGVKLQ